MSKQTLLFSSAILIWALAKPLGHLVSDPSSGFLLFVACLRCDSNSAYDVTTVYGVRQACHLCIFHLHCFYTNWVFCDNVFGSFFDGCLQKVCYNKALLHSWINRCYYMQLINSKYMSYNKKSNCMFRNRLKTDL